MEIKFVYSKLPTAEKAVDTDKLNTQEDKVNNMAKWKVGFRKNNAAYPRYCGNHNNAGRTVRRRTALTAMGTMMNNSVSPFYVGLGIIAGPWSQTDTSSLQTVRES